MTNRGLSPVPPQFRQLLRGKVTMLFISHALPKGLQVDEVVRIGAGTLAAVATQPESKL